MKLSAQKTFFLAGVVTSPNYPDNYPDNLERTTIVHVERGKILRLEFTYFEVQYGGNPPCKADYVKITDGDGTTLMDEICGFSAVHPSVVSYFMPPIITTRSNTMEILFHTNDDSYTRAGWSLSWSAVTPGGEDFMFNSIGIFNPLNTETVRNRKNVPRPFDKKGSYIKSIFSGQNQRDKKKQEKTKREFNIVMAVLHCDVLSPS